MRSKPNAATLAIAASVILATAPAGRGVLAATDEISWNAQRRLSWDDFRGPVPRGRASADAAMTAASLRWSYAYTIERSGGVCVYEITKIETAATFDPAASWVEPDHRTADVLAHEQGHFDLTEVHKLMFDERSRGLLGTSGPCRGRNTRAIAKSVERDIAGTLGKIYDDIWSNHERVQAAYDAETEHSMNSAAQKSWLEKIAAALRGQGWDALGFDDAPGLD
jgi:hypothetical protein